MDERFVGREEELEELGGHLRQALAGQGQVCFVTGQPGSGKTALVRRFVQDALGSNAQVVVAVGTCNAQVGTGEPYLPFREALAMLTGDLQARNGTDKVAPENAARLRALLARSVQVLVEVAPELVGLFVPGAKVVGALGKAVASKAGWMDQLDRLAEKKPAAVGEPALDQTRIFEQYTAFVRQLSAEAPLILFLDDLQWADSASTSLLFHLGRHIEADRILLLGAYRTTDVALGRDGGRHPLEPVVHELTRYYGDVSVDLDGILQATGRAFVDQLLDAEPNALGEAFREALYGQTGGHALFTVELIRAMQERGDLARDGQGRWAEAATLDWSALPARVEGVIAERIGRLQDRLREMLMVGSVEGEEFSAEVVARVEGLADREAIHDLSGPLDKQHRLVGARGFLQLGPARLARYRFQHSLFQGYLYGLLGDAERALLHQEVGDALEALVAGQTEEVAAQLARHFEEAWVPAKATAYRLQAGNRARRMSANVEAAAHLVRGLGLVASLPEGPQRIKLELGLQMSLGSVLIATEGYGSPKVEAAYDRARELCRALGDPPELIQVLFGQLLFRLVHGDMERTLEEGQSLLHRAQELGDSGYIVGFHTLLGVAATYAGAYDRARAHLEQAVAHYDPRRHGELGQQQGQDPAASSYGYLSRGLWCQGYPEQALRSLATGLEVAGRVQHAHTLTMVGNLAATLHGMMRRWPESLAHAETALQLAREGHFPLWQANAMVLRGAALAHQGHPEEGIAAMVQGLAVWDRTGVRLAKPHAQARLAEAYLQAGRREEGLMAVDDSLRFPQEAWWLPEQLRLRAELLLLAPGYEAEAEATLHQALALAGSQGARALALRVAMSLARLWQGQGRAEKGWALVASRYACLPEGHDSADGLDARALLEQLAPSAGAVAWPLPPCPEPVPILR